MTHIEIGNMSQWAEKELYEVFMGDWESIDVQTALANSVEYFILNYSKALGQHDVDGELETEETMMLNQLMATRQAARDSAIAALVSQRDQVWPHSQASQPQTKVDDSAQTSQPQTKDDNSAQSSLANISTHSSNTVGDSLQAAVQHQQIDVNSSDKEGQLPIYSDNTLSLPFVASIPVGEQTFFLEAYYDDTHRIEMKLHHYDEENDQTKLLYVTRVSIQDNAEDTRKCSVYIYMAEHSGYEWKISPSSYLECSLNQLERKICYRTVGKLLSYLRNPNKAQHQESIPAEISQVHRKDLLLSAAKYLIKEFSKLQRD
ncbi:MAG: hypothetical protein RMJ44_05685 [Cytophagales bacterium]|nr:hypothetical protein [Cytophagales bacterium]